MFKEILLQCKFWFNTRSHHPFIKKEHYTWGRQFIYMLYMCACVCAYVYMRVFFIVVIKLDKIILSSNYRILFYLFFEKQDMFLSWLISTQTNIRTSYYAMRNPLGPFIRQGTGTEARSVSRQPSCRTVCEGGDRLFLASPLNTYAHTYTYTHVYMMCTFRMFTYMCVYVSIYPSPFPSLSLDLMRARAFERRVVFAVRDDQSVLHVLHARTIVDRTVRFQTATWTLIRE